MKYLQLASVTTPASVSTWFQDELVNRGVDAAYTYYVLSLLRDVDDSPASNHPPHLHPRFHPTTDSGKTLTSAQERRRSRAKQCAVECLKSAADSNEGFEALVEELLARLESPRVSEEEENSASEENEVELEKQQVPEVKSLAERAKKYFDAFPALQEREEIKQIEKLEDFGQTVHLRKKKRNKKTKSPASNDQMGSIVREDTLISSLTEKFDSKLAAIWADAPYKEHSAVWKISFDSLSGKNSGSCDDFLFSIPNLSVFSRILDDCDDESGREAVGCPATPILCLKSSRLNYDREKTAFTEVVPNRKAAVAELSNSPQQGLCGFDAALPGCDEESDEDLLVSPRTHFTPIKEDEESGRPPSSSLDELSSYQLPPDPPKRAAGVVPPKKQQTPSEDSPVLDQCGAPLTEENVKALWKMVDFELPSSVGQLGKGDVLGVAHCWGRDAVSHGACRELRKEIMDEEDEIFRGIFQLGSEEDLDSGQYSAYDTSLEYCEPACSADECGALEEETGCALEEETGCALEEETGCALEEETGCALEEETGCALEYLSHFTTPSTAGNLNQPQLYSPEVYDPAIVASGRQVNELQRRRRCCQQRKPCTFYLEGNCRRTDCKFSHDLSAITCRFWEEGSCFKGMACPFLHGYAPIVERTTEEKREQVVKTRSGPVHHNKFTIESEQDFPSLGGNPHKGVGAVHGVALKTKNGLKKTHHVGLAKKAKKKKVAHNAITGASRK